MLNPNCKGFQPSYLVDTQETFVVRTFVTVILSAALSQPDKSLSRDFGEAPTTLTFWNAKMILVCSI